MARHPFAILTILSGLALHWSIPVPAQTVPRTTTQGTLRPQSFPPQDRADIAILRALQGNPITAPYRISTSLRDGRVILSGKVGTSQVHDTAIRIAIATGYPFRDDLQIDTAEVYRVASMNAWNQQAAGGIPSLGGNPFGGNPYYIYPQPLFGRLDEPFYGYEPPAVSYPPWWQAVAMRGASAMPGPAANNPPLPAGTPNPAPYGQGAAPGGDPAASPPIAIPLGPEPEDGTIEMTLSPQGRAVLRGAVPTLADRVAIGQKIAQTPGITEVVNLLSIKPKSNDAPPPAPEPATVPPGNPAPENPPAPENSPAPEANAAPAPLDISDQGDLGNRLRQALQKRPVLASLGIKAVVRDGIAYLTGKVPSIYEAMLAFRVAQQTPGVRDVQDRLEFIVPDGEQKNPLIQRGRPEDVEPYLSSQIRRQVADLAHIDQVRLAGATLDIRGTIRREDDRARLEAILRSMPVLRGFRFTTQFVVE